MKKNLFILIYALLLGYGLANAQVEADYTVPSWTLYQMSVKAGSPNPGVLVSKDYPYNVNVAINGKPTTQFGATWFTNSGVTGSKLQLKQGITSDFTGAREINATSVAVNNIQYISTRTDYNQESINLTGFPAGTTRSYTSNKALIDNLQPNTTYSYRVGGINGKWSETGTFTTAKANKDTFEFIYITDSQANETGMFELSRKTVAAAQQKVPNAKFLLITGDLVQNREEWRCEWEWEQWFETMKASWQKLPIAPLQGNHDISPDNNWFHHFHTDKSYNASVASGAQTAMEGTVYSFVYGDALFMCINFEDYAKGETYYAALEAWIRAQVAINPNVKWKIVAFHKTMFTGSSVHQDDADGKEVRNRLAPVFQELGIDLALQGHDHIYEVIGVLKSTKAGSTVTHAQVSGAVTGQGSCTQTPSDGTKASPCATGKQGGTFNVADGMVYFLNNSSGEKKYFPRSQAQMNAAQSITGIANYWDMFYGFGQTTEPTFSHVTVSTAAIKIATYTVNNGVTALFDEFTIVKTDGAVAEADYTVPSWTLYQMSVKAGAPNTALLVSKYYPYNVNVTVNGNPSTQFGAAWFTNSGVTGSKLQLKEGNTSDFTGAREINATSVAVNNLNYIEATTNYDVMNKTGFADQAKRSYMSNKVLIDNLQPNTTYSYRVGGVNGAWSEIGTFTTAKANKDAFEFIYVTDTQAYTEEMFEVSRKTLASALQNAPDAKFALITGDMVETYAIYPYYPNYSEWEWEQWFESMKETWKKLPIAPMQGNHDTSTDSNWFHHFNTDKSYNASVASGAKTAMEGTVYSFVCGDALFMCISYEDYANGETYFAALEAWMRAQIAANPNVKWKIVAFHKTMFTGSTGHQSGADGKIARERMAPAFQDMGIDLAIQGHDHVYEVIGVLKVTKSGSTITYTHLQGAVSEQTKVTGGTRQDMTGIHGGKFNVSDGVLYFLNNSAGKKKYEPSTKSQMDAAYSATGVPGFYEMFNRFGQTGEPTFSRVTVSTASINIATYTVSDSGVATLFDEFSIVKPAPTSPGPAPSFNKLFCP